MGLTRRRWIFSLRWASYPWPKLDAPAIRRLAGETFGLVFPDGCRICEEQLREVSRVPVCARCLDSVEPFSADCMCVRCRTPFLNGRPLDSEGVCALCREGLTGYDAAYSFGSYDGNLRLLIHVFKYQGVSTLAAPLGKLLARALPLDKRFDAVVPMPMHWWRRWRRGFNQAEPLAAIVASRIGVPAIAPVPRLWGRRQSGLTLAARRRGAASTFGAAPKGSLEGKRLLLVDDVLTTGATAAACARALKRAGASHVSVLALARADRRIAAAARTGAS